MAQVTRGYLEANLYPYLSRPIPTDPLVAGPEAGTGHDSMLIQTIYKAWLL